MKFNIITILNEPIGVGFRTLSGQGPNDFTLKDKKNVETSWNFVYIIGHIISGISDI